MISSLRMRRLSGRHIARVAQMCRSFCCGTCKLIKLIPCCAQLCNSLLISLNLLQDIVDRQLRAASSSEPNSCARQMALESLRPSCSHLDFWGRRQLTLHSPRSTPRSFSINSPVRRRIVTRLAPDASIAKLFIQLDGRVLLSRTISRSTGRSRRASHSAKSCAPTPAR